MRGTVLHPTGKEHLAVEVDIQPDVRDIAAQLGAGVPYALKALAGRLADDPGLGRPSGLPGILTVTVDGDMFEDCPDLSVGYIREPDWIEIRFLRATPSTELSADTPVQQQEQEQEQEHEQDRDQLADPAAPRSPYDRSPMHGGASLAGSSTMPPTPTLRSAPVPTPPPSPLWKRTSAFRYPLSCTSCGC
ncbi:hypothetical protein SALBM311S_12650 [Streptomyces alboniger]